MTPPVPWHEDSRDTPTINGNVAGLDHKLASSPGGRDPFSLELVRQWHVEIHNGCKYIPRPEYVGSFRGEPMPHIRVYTVGFGQDPLTGARPRFTGAPPNQVAALLDQFGKDLNEALGRWDDRMPTAEDATLSRLNEVLEGVAVFYGTWLRIHPFADGNGRTARVLVNWVMARYWQPPILPGRPVDDKSGLVAVTSPAIPEVTADYRALTNHLRKRLKGARNAAVAAARA